MRRFHFPLLLAALFVPLAASAQSPEERLAAASALFGAGKYAEAAQRLDGFLAANPKHPKTGTAAFALGRCRTELKQYPQAVAAYEKAVASKDASVLLMSQLGLGEAAIYSKQFDKAAVALESALQGKLSSVQTMYAWYWLGQADFELKRYGPSMEAYDHIIKDFATVEFADSAHFGAGLAALKLGKGDEAKARLKTMADHFSKSEDRPRALLIVGQIDLSAKRWAEARGTLEELLRSNPAAEIHNSAEDGLAQALLELQDYGAAIPRLESTIGRMGATEPRRFRAELSLGHCRYRQKQYDLAVTAYTDASKSTDDAVAAEGFYWTGNALLAANRPGEASAAFAKVAVRAPKHDLAPKAQLKAGDALLSMKQGEAASAAYKVVVDKYPASPQAAEARKALGEIVDALSDPGQLATALKNAPPAERQKGTVRLARIHLSQKRYAETIALVTEFLKMKPPADLAGQGNYYMGLAYDAQQKDALAATALADAVRLAPNAEWVGDAQARLAWIYLTLKQGAIAEKAASAALAQKLDPQAEQQARLALLQSQVDQQKWDAALDGSKALLEKNPPADALPTILYTQAWVNQKKGKADDALPIWERIASEYPKSSFAAEALLHVGDSRLKAEKYDEARDKYTTLVTDFPKSPYALEARFKMGSALYNLNKSAEAASAFDAVANDKAAGTYLPEALYWAGVAYSKAEKKEDAIQRLSRLVTQFPTHARVTNAKIRLAALKAS
jgi:TolA-binding protein